MRFKNNIGPQVRRLWQARRWSQSRFAIKRNLPPAANHGLRPCILSPCLQQSCAHLSATWNTDFRQSGSIYTKKRKFQQIDPAPDHRSKKIPYNERMSSDLSNSLTATEQKALSNCRRLPARFDVAQAPTPLKWRTDNVSVKRAAKRPGMVLSRHARYALKHSGVSPSVLSRAKCISHRAMLTLPSKNLMPIWAQEFRHPILCWLKTMCIRVKIFGDGRGVIAGFSSFLFARSLLLLPRGCRCHVGRRFILRMRLHAIIRASESATPKACMRMDEGYHAF